MPALIVVRRASVRAADLTERRRGGRGGDPRSGRELIGVALLLLVVGFPSPRPANARPALDADSIARLDKGEVLYYSQKVEGSRVMEGKAIGVFDDIPEAVIHVLLDVEKYKHYLPRIKDSRIVKRRGWHSYGVFETALPWPAKDCWAYLKFTRYDKPGRVYEIKWWMVNGTLNQYTGSALVEPWNKNTTRSVLTYRMLFEPKTSGPDSLISDGVKKVARIIVDRTRLRLQALRKFNKLPKELLKPVP